MIALQSELQQRHGVDVKFSSFDFAAPDLHSRAHAVLSSAVGFDRISVLVYGRIIASGSIADIQADANVREAYLGTGEA